jgi:hypothetical protein
MTSPSSPLWISSFALRKGGSKRRIKPICSLTRAFCTASFMSTASDTRIDMGFSQNTCFPACAQATTMSRWLKVGVTIMTASKSFEPSASSRRV